MIEPRNRRKNLSIMEISPEIVTEPVIWQPKRTAAVSPWKLPSMPLALWRGLTCSCPACGKTKLFAGYLRQVDVCSACETPLGRVRADDAPPYFTIFVVGHLVVPSMFMVDRSYHLSDLTQALIWLPVTTLLCLGLLRPIKGATVGLMLKLGLIQEPSNG